MQTINIDTFLRDTFKGVMRMMAYARRATALLVDKDENGAPKCAMVLLYYDDPEHNQRVLDAVKRVGEELDGEDKNREEETGQD